METKDLSELAIEENSTVPDMHPTEEAEDAPAIAMHPLVVALRQLEILQNQVFLAGPTSNVQAQSVETSTPAPEDTGPYCRLACDVLSCTVNACELWREWLLRQTVLANTNCSQISNAELYRLLVKLLAAMHILDCLKDSKQVLRFALASVTAQEGDEQQLLTAVQEFFNMPSACLVLLRDILLEQPEAFAQTKTALGKLLEFQLATVVEGSSGPEAERKGGSFKSKRVAAVASAHAVGDSNSAPTDVNIASRSGARIALSLLVHLYCWVDSAELEYHAAHPPAAEGAGPTTPKEQAQVTQRLRTCMATLRTTPIVPGYGDVSIDLLKPLQGLPQLGPPWEAPTGVDVAAMEDRYNLAAVAAAAGTDFGRLVEDLLALKLQYESDSQPSGAPGEGRNNSAGGSSGQDLRTSAPDMPHMGRSNTAQAALSRSVGGLALRAIQLLKDWQAAILQLDAFRTWQRRQQQEEGDAVVATADSDVVEAQLKNTDMPRCAFTTSDMPDVVRMVSYVKGLYSILNDNMTWMEPLLRVHCAAHLAQLMNSVVNPISSGALGLPLPSPVLPASLVTTPQIRQSQPLLSKASCEGVGVAPSEITDPGNDVPVLAAGIGRLWKNKAAQHGHTRPVASSCIEGDVAAPPPPDAPRSGASGNPQPSGPLAAPPLGGHPELPNLGPSQRTTEESADTSNLIASITADGGADWNLNRNDPSSRMRDWFTAGGSNPGASAFLSAPLHTVPEVQVPTSGRAQSATAGPAQPLHGGRGGTQHAELGAASNPLPSDEPHWLGSRGARGRTTGTELTDEGIECTVSSVDEGEGLITGLDSDDSVTAVVDDDMLGGPSRPPAAGLAQAVQQPWPGADLAWPQPPVPSASWLSGNVTNPPNNGNNGNGTRLSAGGASGNAGVAQSSSANPPRVPAPAAVSTNPLYIYPSAAREAVAEQEHGTVAIWMEDEGGALSAPPLAALGPGAAAKGHVSTGLRDEDEEASTPKLSPKQRQQPASEFSYGDDPGDTPQLDSGARQTSCYDGSPGRSDMQLQDGTPDMYSSEIQLAHLGHLNLPPPMFSDHLSYDGLVGAAANSEATAAAVGPPKKSGVSRLKRIKKLFSKGPSADKALPATAGPLVVIPEDDNLGRGVSDPAMEVYYGGADFPPPATGLVVLPATYLPETREITNMDMESSGGGGGFGGFGNGVTAPPGSGASGGGYGAFMKGAAAFMDIPERAREEQRCQRLRIYAGEIEVCLAQAGLAVGADRTNATAGTPTGRSLRAIRKSSAARTSIKKLVTSIKGKGNARKGSGGGINGAVDSDAPAWAVEAAQARGLDAAGFARLRNSAELMAEELHVWLRHRRDRGKSSTKDGPSTMQLMALSTELRSILTITLPSLEPLLVFRAKLAAAADLSPILLLDPSRSYGGAAGNGLAADAHGSVPWELAQKGVMAANEVTDKSLELPILSGVTLLTLYKDAIESLQVQQALAIASGYPEPPTASRLMRMYRRQAKWCLSTFMRMAARKVWGTYKAQAMRAKLGVVVPAGASDVAASTIVFHGLFRPMHQDYAMQDLLTLVQSRSDASIDSGAFLVDQLTGALDGLILQSASRTAELLLGSDLTSLVAVKQQLEVYSTAANRLRQELPSVRPWKDVWLAALAARAASSPTCSPISEVAAAAAAAITQGCSSNAPGINIRAEDIILMHACSVAALRTLSTWSYDMTAVKFRPTKHTKMIWESLVGNTQPESSQPLSPDGADITLTSVIESNSARQGGPQSEASTAFFGRAHVQALHGLINLDGIGRWVVALRRHAVDLLADAAPLMRRVHELYDTSLAGPRGPSMRESGGASGYLQLQQRWLRDRGHSELLVSAHRALQALGNTVAAVAIVDSILAERCLGRAPHLVSLSASAMQADQQAYTAVKAMASADAGATGTGVAKPTAAVAVGPPPKGSGLAGLLVGQQLPPGLMAFSQSAVKASSIVQERLQEQLPAAFGLPGMWRALYECLHPFQPARPEPLLSTSRLWSVLQMQLSCLTVEEQVVHTTNVGDGVYVSAAALVQLASGTVAPGSVLPGDTMTYLQQAVALDQLKYELSVTSANASLPPTTYTAGHFDKATLEQLKAWSARADSVRAAWDRALQLTVGAGTIASKTSGQRGTWPLEATASQTLRAVDAPALVPCSAEPWTHLAQQASATGAALVAQAAAAAAAAPKAPSGAQQLQQQANNSQGAPGSRGQTWSQGRAPSHPGMLPPASARNAPPRPPTNNGMQPPGSVTGGNIPVSRTSLSGPPLPPRGVSPGPAARSSSGQLPDPPPSPKQAQLQQLRAASQALMRSPRGDHAGAYGLFSTAGAPNRSRPASSLGDMD